MSKVRVYEIAKQLGMDQKTLVGLFQSMGIEMAVWMKHAIELKPWLPSSAFDFWVGYAEASQWDWRSAASLVIITVGSVVASERIFNRIDIP